MFLAGALCLACVLESAAAQTPTADQLEIFRGLSPEQQQAILEELGDSGEQGSSPSSESRRPAEGVPEATRRVDTLRQAELPEDPVLEPLGTVLLDVEPEPKRMEQLDATERVRIERLAEMIRARNPYQLDSDAVLHLPGFAPIALGGLSEEQATRRLALEPALRQLKVELILLPLSRTGLAGLEPFGYNLFDNAPSTFSPMTDVPVPADYIIGPGDELNLQLFGSQNRNLRLTVSRDGALSFPELGPIRVGGLGFNAAREAIETRVGQQLIGTQVSVSMGQTRSIRVYVMGDAKVPGSYLVSGLATMTAALFASGGVKTIGSLRDIQLKRQGEIVQRLDLYDLLVKGDTSDDAKLLPNDVIFIPPVGPTVSVDGEVKRPAVYELRGESSATEIVQIAGGLTPEADRSRTSLTRIDEAGRRVVEDVDLSLDDSARQSIGNGDVLRVARRRPQIDAGITLEGFVHRPGQVAWREGLRLTRVIGSVDELKATADQRYVLIRRETGPDRRVSVLSADLVAAWAAPGSAADILLMPRDRIVVFDLAPGRDRIIQPLIEELKLQSELSRPTEIVQVSGRVKAAGEYPLEPGMRVSDLLRAGGSLDSAAFGGTAELTRYTITEGGSRTTELIDVDIAAIRRGDTSADLPLQPFDFLLIKETPDWSDRESVTLRGEVRFPGTYSIRRGETLRQVLDRAGGLTTLAFPEGGAFTREDLKVIEQQQLDRLAVRVRSDLASLALQAANAGQASAAQSLQSGQVVLDQLQTAEATGRMVIDLPGLLAEPAGGGKDILLRAGDELVIPKIRQEVSVIGEVLNATSHLYLPELNRDDYVSLSGGTSQKADRGRIYVVRADGSVATRRGSTRSRAGAAEIRSGDTIVVPLDTEKLPRLPFWQAVTQILYNLAVSVAAVNSF